MATVVLDHVSKTYPNGFEAVKDLSIEIQDGEFLVLVGPSGCGKTTALRMIAGLEEVTTGEIRIGDNVVNDKPPKDRDIAMVFQNYALYPHMSVGQNIGFALKMAGVPKSERAERVGRAAKILQLEEQLDKKPGQLSGGQRQRVAMGRAIVREPAAFLMDEPLSNLDAKLRVHMRAEISAIQRALGVTTFYVTHDQVEAMTMGDRVAVIKDGVLQQVDKPRDLYNQPANVFVAAFIGSPSMNIYETELTHAGGQYTLRLGSTTLDLDDSIIDARPTMANYVDQPLIVGIRPEDLNEVDTQPDHSSGQRLRSTVALVESLGAEVMVHFRIDAKTATTGDPDKLDETTTTGEHPNCVARFGPDTEVGQGDIVEVNVNTAKMHFFDPISGLAITA